MLEIGHQLGKYEIRRVLGRGGWGEVYEGHDRELGRDVAIKILPPERSVDPDLRARFEREARTVAGLDHPGIVTLYSVEEADGLRFITMQLVHGQTLAELIPKSGLPLAQIFRIAIPLADAVAAAHQRGVIHRDLKPGNVMVTAEGQVKVLDFGLAKLAPPRDAGETLSSESQTTSGKILGTLAYMSPEQLRAEEVDHRSDIFSLGIVLYEMATGRWPFRGKTSIDIAASILRDAPYEVAEVKADLPRHLGRIIRICLEEDPDRRFQSALDVRNELDQLRSELETGLPVTGPVQLPGTAETARRAWVWPAAVALTVLAAITGGLWMTWNQAEAPPPAGAPAAPDAAKRIVVLPFRNVGPPQVDYFAAGITEEVSSRLTSVDGLAVISRMSADQYAQSNKTAGEIGNELDVQYIVQGTVRWAPNGDRASRVRISPEIIRVEDDTQICCDGFNRELQDILEIQSEVAGNLVRSLGSLLSTGLAAVAESRPTASLEAYQAYLRGLSYARRPVYTLDNWSQAAAGFSEAVQLDAEFALAWARLARCHSIIYHLGMDPTPARRELAKEAIDRALALAPEDPEVRLALGYYHYRVNGDYRRALAEFALAERSLPNHVGVLEGKGYVLRREGRWDEALEHLERAFRLNPRNAALAAELGESHANLRRYAEAVRWYDQSIVLDPVQIFAYVAKVWCLWLWQGDLAAARQTLEAMPRTEDSLTIWTWFWQEVYEGDYPQALDRLPADPSDWIEWSEVSSPASLLAAQAYRLLGQQQLARRSFDAARALLEAEVESRPGDPRLRSALGLAYAGLGRPDEAAREGLEAVDLRPLSEDAFSGAAFVADLAVIYLTAGRVDNALDRLELLLERPSMVSPALLRLDPRWDPVRDRPRFRRLLEERE